MVIPQSSSYNYYHVPMLKSKHKGEITNLTLAICHIDVMSLLFCFSQP